MLLLDHTAATPAENLAVDEALLDEAEADGHPREVLRLWESPRRFVVLGRSCRVVHEVDLQQCRANGIEVLRRSSGGGTILTGPGCLMYALVLSTERRPELRSIDRVHRYVLERMAAALAPLAEGIAREGTSDLAIGGQKCSGNSLRCRRNHVLYHGTLLYACTATDVAKYLTPPPREPAYRQGRSHSEFMTWIGASATDLRAALTAAWRVEGALAAAPTERVQQLVAGKFTSDAWNLQW